MATKTPPAPKPVKPKPKAAFPGSGKPPATTPGPINPAPPFTPIVAVGDKPTQIVQETVIGNPDMSQATVVTKASVEGEYVSAGSWGWWSDRYLRSLPNPTDRFMRDFGSKLYEEDMPLDAQVYSTLSILVMSVLAEGVHLTPGVDKDEADPAKVELAGRILAFCQYNLHHLNRPLTSTLYELVEGMLKVGHKVAEKVYKPVIVRPEDQEQICLVDLKPKPHRNVAFVTDASYNVVGILYIKPGQSIITGVLLPMDLRNIPDLLPRTKFAIPTFRPTDGDPRGRSHLASVYTPWWKKQGLHTEHMAYIARFAQPAPIFELPENAQAIPVLDNNGNQIGSMAPIDAGNAALMGIRGGAVFTHANGGRVYLLEANGNASAIMDSFEHEDRSIAKGLLFNTLTTEEAEHMARAASSTHQDVMGIFIAYLRGIIEAMIAQDVLHDLVLFNYGEAALEFIPRVSLGNTETQDWPAVATAIAALMTAGYIHWTQMPVLDDMLNAPRDMEQFQADEAGKQAQAAALAQQAHEDNQQRIAQGVQPGQPGQPAGGKPPAEPAPKSAPKPGK